MDLSDRLFEEYNGHRTAIQCHDQALELMAEIPQELQQNVSEWLDDKPLSDIKVNGVSINDVFAMFKDASRPLHFIQILESFAVWKKCNYYDDKHFFMTHFCRM